MYKVKKERVTSGCLPDPHKINPHLYPSITNGRKASIPVNFPTSHKRVKIIVKDSLKVHLQGTLSSPPNPHPSRPRPGLPLRSATAGENSRSLRASTLSAGLENLSESCRNGELAAASVHYGHCKRRGKYAISVMKHSVIPSTSIILPKIIVVTATTSGMLCVPCYIFSLYLL